MIEQGCRLSEKALVSRNTGISESRVHKNFESAFALGKGLRSAGTTPYLTRYI